MKKNAGLLILGAGQYGSVVKEIAESMNRFDKISFLDDGFCETACQENIIGKISDMDLFDDEYMYAIVAIGNSDVRFELIERIKCQTKFEIPVLISKNAYVSPSSKIGCGTVIEPLAGVHANAVIGEATYISMGAVVNHNATVGNCCHVDNAAVVSRGAFVSDGTKLQAGTVFK